MLVAVLCFAEGRAKAAPSQARPVGRFIFLSVSTMAKKDTPAVAAAKAAAKGEPFEVTFKSQRLGMKIDRFQHRLMVIEFEDGPGKGVLSEARHVPTVLSWCSDYWRCSGTQAHT